MDKNTQKSVTPARGSEEWEAHCVRLMFGNTMELNCPYCGFEYVHFSKPLYFSGKNNYKAREIYGIGVRGDVIVMPFNCEDGHDWVIVLGEHKGNISYKMVMTNMDNDIHDGKDNTNEIQANKGHD